MGVTEPRSKLSLLPTLLLFLAWGCTASDIRDVADEGGPSGPNVSGPNTPNNSGSPSNGSGNNTGSGSTPSPGSTGTPGGNDGTPAPGGSGAGNGTVGTPPNQPNSNTTVPPPAASACANKDAPGPRQLRRLNAQEFAASIRDLFGADAPITQVFNDPKLLGFTVDAPSLVVADLNADQLMSNAEAVADWAVKNQLSKIASCNSHDANCGRQIVKTFGRKVFREPIADNDSRVSAYVDKLFLTEANFTDGVTAVVTAMLQSPHFLYRKELGAGGVAAQELTPHEVATNLSYLITGSTPDETLLSAADQVANNSLPLRSMLDQQAERLLGSSGEKAVMSFMTGWLGLDRLQTTVKDDTVFKLPDDVRGFMADETRRFLLDAFSSNLPIGGLFSADYSWINRPLADYYGLSGAASGNDFQKVTLSGKRDGGLLGQGGILTGYARSDSSSPTQRGHLVRSRLLCQEVPPPPGGLDTAFKPAAMTAKTTREKYLLEHASPQRGECYGCHELMDLIGVSFEHYDAFGRYREQENGVPIDATGTVTRADGAALSVAIDGLSGPQGLGAFLAENDIVKSCVTRYWSYFAFGRASWAEDSCTYDAVQSEAASASFSMKSIIMGIVHAPHFTRRVADQ